MKISVLHSLASLRHNSTEKLQLISDQTIRKETENNIYIFEQVVCFQTRHECQKFCTTVFFDFVSTIELFEFENSSFRSVRFCFDENISEAAHRTLLKKFQIWIFSRKIRMWKLLVCDMWIELLKSRLSALCQYEYYEKRVELHNKKFTKHSRRNTRKENEKIAK